MRTIFHIIILSTFVEAVVLTDNFCLLNRTEGYLKMKYGLAKQCSKGVEFHSWSFSKYNALKMRFPIDSEVQNYVRKVSNILFSVVKPTPLNNVKLVAVSNEALVNVLDLNPAAKDDTTFVNFVAGNWLHPQGIYYSHRYGGHQVIILLQFKL